MTESNAIIRPARHTIGSSGDRILREVCVFAEKAHLATHETVTVSLLDPLGVLGPDRVRHCDEAFVAEVDGVIVGAVTLAFKGIFGGNKPTLDGLYVLPEYRRRGIGCRLITHAVRRFAEVGRTPVLCNVESDEMVATSESFRRRHPELCQHVDFRDDL
jgi:ribosomal protein S18 acetylase RimI-like enzyme